MTNETEALPELPPLPEHRAIRAGHSFPKVYAMALTDEQVREYATQYGAACAKAARLEWQPIATAPKTGRTLLLGYFNSHGQWRTLRGQWFSQDAIDESWEEPDLAGEGWYETPVEIDDTPNCFWTEPTHWQPLPTPPGIPAPADGEQSQKGAR